MRETNVMDEDWPLLASLFPRGWRRLASETKALKGLRQDKSEENLLRTLLLHLACGYSLRETVVRARAAKLANLSDVALLKRLRKSKEWLQALCCRLFEEAATHQPRVEVPLRLVDSTLVKEPGQTGSLWKIHFSLRWPTLKCDYFKLTPTKGAGTGETLAQFPVRKQEHLLADRGYSNYSGIHHVVAHGANVTVRLNPQGIRLLDRRGQRFDLQRRLRSLSKSHEIGSWKISISGSSQETPIPGRLCVLRKSKLAAARSMAKLRRRASKNSTQAQSEALFYTRYVMVFTTAPEQYSPWQILEMYRLRWQVEIVFKRFKQLADLGHVPKHDDDSAQAWLYGKLFVALMTERLIQRAESFSPWGYEVAQSPSSQPLAGI
jgi:hypothetical protein